jgi:hypothetical protein
VLFFTPLLRVFALKISISQRQMHQYALVAPHLLLQPLDTDLLIEHHFDHNILDLHLMGPHFSTPHFSFSFC